MTTKPNYGMGRDIKKSPRSKDLGPNPPKEEGGGDNLGMPGYKAMLPSLGALVSKLSCTVSTSDN